MKPEIEKLMNKAERAVRSAEKILEDGECEFSASRAYYALFYIAEALLLQKDLRFKKHTAVHAAFGEQFAKTAILDPKFHRWLLDAFDQRIVGDYDVDAVISSDDSRQIINQAKEFLATAGAFLERE